MTTEAQRIRSMMRSKYFRRRNGLEEPPKEKAPTAGGRKLVTKLLKHWSINETEDKPP